MNDLSAHPSPTRLTSTVPILNTLGDLTDREADVSRAQAALRLRLRVLLSGETPEGSDIPVLVSVVNDRNSSSVQDLPSLPGPTNDAGSTACRRVTEAFTVARSWATRSYTVPMSAPSWAIDALTVPRSGGWKAENDPRTVISVGMS